jgi:hypothetical protein
VSSFDAESDPLPPGRSFILRIWLAASRRDPEPWRITLQDVDSGARRGFATFDEFFLFLEAIGAEMVAE